MMPPMERFDDACPIRLGDTWQHVSDVMNVANSPEPFLVDGRPKGFHCQFETHGLWIFLDDKLHVRSIRFDAPFRGHVDGIAIGETAANVLHIKGRPDRKWPIADGIRRWLYDRDAFMRIDFNETNLVETIFV